MKVRIFSEKELRKLVSINLEALKEIEAGFGKLANGQVSMPPIMRVVVDNEGDVDIKSAYVKNWDSFALKVSSGFFNNFKLGLPSGSGLMVLIDAKTGVPKSLLLDNGYLTDVRTALAGSVAAKYLAPNKLDSVGVFGTGAQARYQVKGLKLVRNFNKLYVYGRSAEKAKQYIQEMGDFLGISCELADPKEVVKRSQVVITTTPAQCPIIKNEWLHEGLHITAMGSDAEDKNELEPAILKNADQYICDSVSQCKTLGELHHAIDHKFLSEDEVINIKELGDLVSGSVTGRTNENQVTVADLTGTGVQDTAIARYAYDLGEREKVGIVVE